MEKIVSNQAPPAIGPYSQAITTGNLVFVSGQLPLDTKGSIVGITIKEQTIQTCRNIEAILNAAGTCCKKAVKCNCYLKNMSDFDEFNKAYNQFFTDEPARCCISPKELPRDVLIEIEVIAEIPQD